MVQTYLKTMNFKVINSTRNKKVGDDHRAPLVRWSLHKYKCLWDVREKGQGSNLQEGDSHTYTLRLG